jgi:hypothetical protein
MNEDLVAQIQQRIGELPPDVQAAIASSDFDKKVQAVGQRHGLHIDQMEKLGDEVMLVMLGFMSAESFTSNIVAEVGVDAEKAGRIAADINAEILLPIRESLKTMPTSPAPSAAAPVTTPAPAPSAPATPVAKPATPAPHPAEMMLSQKTVTVPPPVANTPAPPPQKPTNYKADPYREPPVP